MSTLGMYERSVSSALCAKLVHVYLAHHELFFQREAFRLCHQGTVLVDERIAPINHVLRTLAEATRAVYVTAYQSGTLLRKQALKVGVLADEIIGCREVKYDVGSRQHEVVRRGQWRPYVLTKFYAELHAACRLEQRFFATHAHPTAGVANHNRFCKVV